jgi:hypothetical protein
MVCSWINGVGAQGGMAALGREEGWRRGRRRISGKRLRSIEMLKSQGMSNRAIAHRLGVSEKAIRKLVGPSKPAESAQLAFAEITTVAAGKPTTTRVPSAKSTGDAADRATPSAEDRAGDRDPITAPADDGEAMPMSLDRDARDRTFDRQLAYLGLLDDAAPPFREGASVPGVGVLFALPCLVESGLFRISRKLYGEIGPAFYGLRTTLLTLLLMALLRIKRPEHLKERDPAAFGRLLGLDRAPEVKTLRRRLTRLAAHHCAEQLGAETHVVRYARTARVLQAAWLYRQDIETEKHAQERVVPGSKIWDYFSAEAMRRGADATMSADFNEFRGSHDGSDIAHFSLHHVASGGIGSDIATASIIALRCLREKCQRMLVADEASYNRECRRRECCNRTWNDVLHRHQFHGS